MEAFSVIHETALDRIGGIDALNKVLPKPRSISQLKELTDMECLAAMSRRIFEAGLNRKVIDNKWSGFLEVFRGFDIDANRLLSDEALEKLMSDKRIVRHWGKIQSVRHNAQVIHEINEKQGGFVNYLAEWPSDNIIGLWDILAKRFKQLGGASGLYFLRRINKDTFLLTRDVINAMRHWGTIKNIPKNKKQKLHVQSCMNEWQAESQLPYCQVSMILAKSVD